MWKLIVLVILLFVMNSLVGTSGGESPKCSTGYWYTPPVYKINPLVKAPARYRQLTLRVLKESKIPAEIFIAMIMRESSWRANAVNTKNKNGSVDYGIAQLNSNCLEEFKWKFYNNKEYDPMNPVPSLWIASRLLKAHYGEFGTWPKAISAYNCGPERVRKGKIPETTRTHVNWIMQTAVSWGYIDREKRYNKLSY